MKYLSIAMVLPVRQRNTLLALMRNNNIKYEYENKVLNTEYNYTPKVSLFGIDTLNLLIDTLMNKDSNKNKVKQIKFVKSIVGYVYGLDDIYVYTIKGKLPYHSELIGKQKAYFNVMKVTQKLKFRVTRMVGKGSLSDGHWKIEKYTNTLIDKLNDFIYEESTSLLVTKLLAHGYKTKGKESCSRTNVYSELSRYSMYGSKTLRIIMKLKRIVEILERIKNEKKEG